MSNKLRKTAINKRKKGKMNLHVMNLTLQDKARKKKALKNCMWATFMMFVLGVFGFVVYFTGQKVIETAFVQNNRFALNNVDVEIKGALRKSDVIRWSGLHKGENLLNINLTQVSENIKRIPYVEDIRIERQMPDTIRIRVIERQPIACLIPKTKNAVSSQQVYYLDGQGIVMKPKAGEKIKALPILIGVDIDSVIEGVVIDDQNVQGALRLIRLCDLHFLKDDLALTYIDVQKNGALTVLTQQQSRIRFRNDVLEQQIERLQFINNYAKDNRKMVQVVDLTPEKNVPVKFYN
jgi:cell division protein FtsQ